jgi:dTDP-4-amino-4,6-dideoxygalactose transaminase
MATTTGGKVPLNDLRRWSSLNVDAIAGALRSVTERGWYILGPELSSFEAEFAAYCGVRHCIGVANGTDALEIALRALNVGVGDDVATVANAGMYGSGAIVAVGARPVFVDIDPLTMTMSAASLAERLTPRTRAIIVTHLYGKLADMDGLLAVAQARGLPVIEDCAQAHGARRAGQRAGAFGAIGCFSFYPTKNLGALGDAGAVVTNDDGLAQSMTALRQYGWTQKYKSDLPHGRNSRTDEFQAALLRMRLPSLDEVNARRRAIVAHYCAELRNENVRLPVIEGEDHVAHLCVVRVQDRQAVAHALSADGVESAVHYPIADYDQTPMRQHSQGQAPLPHTLAATGEILSIPCFPELTEDEIARVVSSLRRAVRAGHS